MYGRSIFYQSAGAAAQLTSINRDQTPRQHFISTPNRMILLTALRGALPPVLLRAVCLVRAMLYRTELRGATEREKQLCDFRN
jgi:hypothetical protein